MGAPTAKLETVVIVSPFKINALVFALITCTLILICLFTDNWLTAYDVKQGLWKNCTLASSIPSLASSIKANQNSDFFICVPLAKILWVQISGSLVMICLACSAIGIGLVLAAFKHSERQERKMKFYFTAAVVFGIGAVSIFFALILFPTMLRTELADRGKDKWYFGWSYGLAWGATIFLVAALGLLYYDRNREEIFYKEQLYLNQDEENMIVDQEAKIKTLN